jgi:hypothetical protein
MLFTNTVCSSQFAHYITNLTHPLEGKILVATQGTSKIGSSSTYNMMLFIRQNLMYKKGISDLVVLFVFHSSSDVTQTGSWPPIANDRMIT